MMRLPRFIRALALVLTALPATAAAPSPAPVDFARDVLPIFQSQCVECHGPQKHKGDLRLDQDGPSLAKAASAADPAASELLRRIALPRGDDDVMPNRGEPLTSAQVEAIRRWVAQGAVWPRGVKAAGHWAYAKPAQPLVPTVPAPYRILNPIDAFVAARLKQEGLPQSPPAERATLLRRVTLDLTGLPPTPAEVDAFLADDSPNAYDKVVDRLLASPQFGVRWARPWLDYARYADSHGFQRDDLRDLWAYRDWVVDALNADMPFDRFTIDQLAGDLLPNATKSQRIATGFNRSAPTNVEAGSEPEETRVNQVLDRVNTFATVWLGSTMECCQCHDHKYDPFTMRDYYGLFAFFNSTAIEAERAKPNVRSSIQFIGPEMVLKDSPYQLRPPQAKAAATTQPKPPTTLVMRELAEPRETHVLLRGNYQTPGDVVAPTTPAALPAMSVEPGHRPNRLDLARWAASRENPLVARVTVNRWWSELFGHGLVATPEDFGLRGERPTHAELLDWLACELMDNGWSMKKTLRTIVTSATYRQSSRATPDLLARDDQNLLYARGPRFRMDAEMVRDNALAIAGLISLDRGGPPIHPYQPDGLWVKVGGAKVDYVVSPGVEKFRRGLYVVWKRAAPYPSFVNFDANARLACRVRRPRSNTPLQALTLMNDPAYVEAAVALARRALAERPSADEADRIAFLFRLAVSRAPRPGEIEVLRRLVDEQRTAARADPAAAKRFAAAWPDLAAGTSDEELCAWYAAAAAVLNLDETITKG
jgi:mono/diheme cytochrome c family protein